MPTAPTMLLEGLLRTQDLKNEAAEYKDLRAHAHQVATWARRFNAPVLLAVDSSAQRILGAVTLLAGDDLNTPVFAHRFDGKTVLLVGSIAATTIDLEAAANNARRRGAQSVHGCAIHIEMPAQSSSLDSLTLLHDVTDAQKTA